tara:strand:+ start:734 stop:865 length:132 start_codon:yes stop_codon:yes gene_type:complete
MKRVRWQSWAHSGGEEVPMLVVVVVNGSSDVSTILEIFPRWSS